MEFKNSYPQLCVDDVDRLQSYLQFSFSEQYRQFLLRSNGGTPEKQMFPTGLNECPESVVDFFCHVDTGNIETPDDAHAFSISFSQHEYGVFIPDDCVIIGFCNRDDPLFLNRSGEVWMKLCEDPDETTPGEHCYRLSHSFDEFIASLYKFDWKNEKEKS